MLANLIVLFSGIVGFITIFLILLQYKSNRITNFYLIIIFLIISTRMLLIGIFSIANPEFINTLLTNYHNLLIIITPCMYLYFDHMIKDYKYVKMQDLIHFIIPITFNIVDYLGDVESFKINNLRYYNFIFFTIYSCVYFIFMFKLLLNNVWNRKGKIVVVVKQNRLLKKWSVYFLSTIIFVGIRLILSMFIELNEGFFIFGRKQIWLSALFWLVLYFKIIISPEILYGYTFLNAKINEHRNTANHTLAFWTYNPKISTTNSQDHQLFEKIKENLSSYMAEVDQFSFNTDAYRNTNFSLTDLSNQLRIPKSHLTFLFKYHSKISFSEYKKIIRIQDGLQLIKSGYLATNTYDSLAKEIGFKSYNTFFVSFKDVSGLSPQDFLVQNVKNKGL